MPRYDAALAGILTSLATEGRIELEVHDYYSDDELWAYLGSLDVSVLPYRFGTHSGWLEACRDVGTTVVAPSCGYYDQQGPVLGLRPRREPFRARLAGRRGPARVRDRPALGATVEERRRQRRQVAARHDDIYRSATRGAL